MINLNKAIKQLKELKKLGKNLDLAAENWNQDWQTLIATMLSARTRDDVTIPVANKLFKKYKTVKALAKASIKEIEKSIYSVNFYRNKARNVSNCAKMLDKLYKGKVPHDFNKLIQLPGVGRKTANVFLAESGKQAIGVDTHVHYVSKYLGWTKQKNPHKAEEDLKKLFPKRIWRSINYILVKFGRSYQSKKKKNEILDEIKKIK
ncbi:endonuclease III [Candidatus Woesearchaeota archaeon]|nr:endonuclease III [Candidatus Woesearchaeota archaeon]